MWGGLFLLLRPFSWAVFALRLYVVFPVCLRPDHHFLKEHQSDWIQAYSQDFIFTLLTLNTVTF